MSAGEWVALAALVVSIVAVVLSLRSIKHSGRSAVASERSAKAAEISAREAVKANELQLEEARAAAQRRTPTLIVRRSDRKVEGTVAKGQLAVESRGGRARDVVVFTDWGEARVEPPVLDAMHPNGTATATTENWQRGTDPVPSRVKFKDDQGDEHEAELVARSPTTWTTE
jgi:hypothetical protein